MPFAILIIGVLLIVVAFNNSMGALATELETDIPGYFKWAIAIAAILALGYIPGLRTPSRYLLALVLLVILLAGNNAANIYAGFTSFASTGGTPAAGAAGAANPSAAYVANPATTTDPTQASISGTAGTTSATTATAAATTLTAAQQLAANPLNPNSYIGLAAGFGGLA